MPPHNLPVQRDPLIGREQDVLAVRQLLMREDVGLVTLVGAGGAGKTRVALRVGTDLLPHFDDGVYFVSLASITDPLLVPSAIAQAVGVRDAGSRPLLESLKDHLRHRHYLLIIDNFEHLMTAAPILSELLSVSARLKLLVTSRALLYLQDEHIFQVPPLALPDPAQMAAQNTGHVANIPSVALFLRRVAAVEPTLRISDDDILAAGEICTRLDGLPLAIELAAARVRLYPPRVMRDRLERRLPLLTAGPRDVPARQRTLRDAIAWSYDLLTADEQRLFRCLSVFPSGCAVGTIQAVFADGDDDETSLLDALHSLVDKSLVTRHGDGSREPRFTMLETLREFGLDQLDTFGESDMVRLCHAAVYLDLVEQSGKRLSGPARGHWVGRVEAEHDNVRSALAFSEAASDGGEVMLRFTGALGWFWYWQGHLGEGRRWVEAALAKALPHPTLSRARALFAVGLITFIQGDHDAMRTNLETSVAILRALDDTADLGYSLVMLGVAMNRTGDPDGERQLHGEARALFRLVGDRWGLAFASTNEGAFCAAIGDYSAAEEALTESLEVAAALADTWCLAHSLMNRALMELRRGQLDSAADWYGRSLTALRHDSDRWFISRSLQGLASVLWRSGDPARAAELWGAAEALLDAIGAPVYALFREEYDHDVSGARASLGEEAFARAWMAGRALSPQATIMRAESYAAALASGQNLPPADSVLTAPSIIATAGNSTVQVARPGRPGTSTDSLTAREREVAVLIAQGFSNRQIAESLVIGVRTAENHVAHIAGKIGASSRAQVAVWVVQQGMLPDEP